MKVSKFFDGIGGEWIEFQTSDKKGLEFIEFWQENSIYLYGSQDLPYKVFGQFLSKDWSVGFNQIDRLAAYELANELEKFEALIDLVEWMRKNMENNQFLNILGI